MGSLCKAKIYPELSFLAVLADLQTFLGVLLPKKFLGGQVILQRLNLIS